MNAQELINIITPSDILTLMNDLGADLVKETNEYFIFTSICHKSDSSKLYYYFTKRFYCYSNCGSMDIYELIMRVKDCDFKNAFNYLKSIVSGYNRPIVGFSGRRFKNVDLDEIVIPKIEPIKKQFLYNIFKKKEIKEWSDEGISWETQQKFNIRYDEKNTQVIIPHFNSDEKCIGIRTRCMDEFKIANGRPKYAPLWYDGMCYSHSLGSTLYGINISKDNIKKYKKCIVLESEKAVMQYETMYPGHNIAVSCCGSSLSNIQKKILLELGVEEIVIGLDRQYKFEESDEGVMWKNKILKLSQNLLDYCKVSYIWDTDENRYLDYKMSPTDVNKNILEKLLKTRISIN